MKRGTFKEKSREEKLAAIEKNLARQRAKLSVKTSQRPRIKRHYGLKGPFPHKSAKTKANQPLDDEFKRICRERDGNRCRWIREDGSRCMTMYPKIPVHHINEKSQRPDLRFDSNNGACMCPIHHDYMHHTVAGRQRGRELGLLGGDSYEKAMKERTN